MGKKRFSRQIQQEHLSRHQFSERITEYGWVPTSPPDLGEDFIVSIYEGGEAEGASFYVQLKSVRNLHDRRIGDAISYQLWKKDLLHWEAFAFPVVLLIWDVELREGRWAFIRDIVAQLDERNRLWRKFTLKPTVHIPFENTTDDKGLSKLKAEIGRSLYPLISRGRILEVTVQFKFPDTEKGESQRDAFERHIREGEPFHATADIIERIEFSEWWQKWFGDQIQGRADLHMSGLKSDHPFKLKIILNPRNEGTVTLDNLEFKLEQAGTELLVFSNAHSDYPLDIRIRIRKEGKKIFGSLGYSVQSTPKDPNEFRTILNFMRAISLGGDLRISYQNGEKRIHSGKFDPQPQSEPNPKLQELVEKLCLIQDRVGGFFEIPESGIPLDDVAPILELSEIVEKGYTVQNNATVTMELADEALDIMIGVQNDGKPQHVRLLTPESHVVLFGKEVQVGPMLRSMRGAVSESAAEFEQRLRSAAPGEFVEVKIQNARVIEYFQNWTDATFEDVLEIIA